MKRIICGALVLCLTAGLLSGCGQSGSGQENKPMGRYIEEQGLVLEQLTQIYDFHREDNGDLVFYGKGPGADGTDHYTRNVFSQEGGLKATPVDWLDHLLTEGRFISSLSEGSDGTTYAMVNETNGTYTLHRAKDGGQPQLVEVPDWDQGAQGQNSSILSSEVRGDVASAAAMEGGVVMEGNAMPHKTPFGVVALEDGFVTLFGPQGAVRYRADGTVATRFDGLSYSGVSVYGDQLMMKGSSGQELLIYDLSKNEPPKVHAYENMSFTALSGLDGDGIYLADSTGIYRQGLGGSLWEKLVDGNLTSLAMPNQVLEGITGDGAGGFWGLMAGDDRFQLMHYTYSADTPTNPNTELTIFGLQDNNTVRQAIGEFQRVNPNVRVNFRIALGEDSAATAQDVIRALNTELLAGKGPDLLLLDGLPVDSYLEKGVLADLTELVDGLTQSQGLLPNLLGAYVRDGKTYGIPSRFGFPVMMGTEETVNSIKSLEDLVRLVEKDQSGTPPLLFPSMRLWEDDGMMMDYYKACIGDWMSADGTIDQDTLTKYLTQMTQLNKILRDHTPQSGGMAAMTITATVTGSRGFEAWDMGPIGLGQEEALFHTQTLMGMMNLASIVQNLSDLEGRKLDTLFGGDRYVPQGGVGIVSSGTQQELAAQFVEMLLSSTVQDKYLYDGFPINGASLEQMTAEYLKEFQGDLGFLALCNTLNTPILTDQVIEDAVKNQAKGLLDGTVTPEQAAAKIVEQTKIYLSE